MFEFIKRTQPGEVTHRQSLGRMVTQSTALLMTAIGTLILLLAFLILFHENSNATNGYRLRNLERERSVLLLEQEVLNMEVAQAQALDSLQQDPQVQAMAVVKTMRYVRQSDLQSSSSSSSVAVVTASGSSSLHSSAGSSASSVSSQ